MTNQRQLGPLRALDMRRRNAALVLDQLRDKGTQTRTDLATSTTLTTEGIRELLADLVSNGLVQEAPAPTSGPRRGRPATYYAYAADSGSAFGISIGPRFATIVRTDATGTELDRRRLTIMNISPTAVLNKIVRTLWTMTTDGPDESKTTTLAVVVNGEVDQDAGVVRRAPMQGWEDIPVSSHLQSRLGIPVYCLDAAGAVALSAQREGVAAGIDDVVVLDLSNWIAAGCVQSGVLHRGANGLAGQIRECPVPTENGMKPLWEVVSGSTIAAEAGLKSGSGWREVVAASQAGDDRAATAMREAGKAIVFASAWLIAAYGPQLFVLGGVFSELTPIDRSRLIAEIYQTCGSRVGNQVEIQGSSLGREAWTRGAVHCALDALHALQVDGESSGLARAAR